LRKIPVLTHIFSIGLVKTHQLPGTPKILMDVFVKQALFHAIIWFIIQLPANDL